MMEKLQDYLLGSEFTMYMDNNPLAYCQEEQIRVGSSDGLANLHCLILILNTETGKLNIAVDALSHFPYVPGEMDSDSDCEEYGTISYTMVCEELEEIIDGKNSP